MVSATHKRLKHCHTHIFDIRTPASASSLLSFIENLCVKCVLCVGSEWSKGRGNGIILEDRPGFWIQIKKKNMLAHDAFEAHISTFSVHFRQAKSNLELCMPKKSLCAKSKCTQSENRLNIAKYHVWYTHSTVYPFHSHFVYINSVDKFLSSQLLDVNCVVICLLSACREKWGWNGCENLIKYLHMFALLFDIRNYREKSEVCVVRMKHMHRARLGRDVFEIKK